MFRNICKCFAIILIEQITAAKTYGFTEDKGTAAQNASASQSKTGSQDDGPTQEEEEERLAQNLLQISVFFETLSVQNIIESPKYSVRTNVILSNL